MGRAHMWSSGPSLELLKVVCGQGSCKEEVVKTERRKAGSAGRQEALPLLRTGKLPSGAQGRVGSEGDEPGIILFFSCPREPNPGVATSWHLEAQNK